MENGKRVGIGREVKWEIKNVKLAANKTIDNIESWTEAQIDHHLQFTEGFKLKSSIKDDL